MPVLAPLQTLEHPGSPVPSRYVVDTTGLLPTVFVELADSLVEGFDVGRLLQVLSERVAQLSGAGAVGVLLDDGHGRLRLAATSGPSARLREVLELQTDDGPCLECLRTLEPVVGADLAAAVERWPTFAPAALAAGSGQVHACPMRLRDTTIGALSILDAGEAYGAPEQAVVQALVDVATISVVSARTIESSQVLSAQLQHALDSRVVVEQAKGVVAARESISPDEAFGQLRRRARRSRRSLADVSADVVDSLGS